VVVFEFIIWTPIFVILLLAIIEFALILTNLQQVKAASQAGAKIAAELSNADLASANPADNIDKVDDAVTIVLGSAGMMQCEVILEYNPTCGGITPDTKTAGACAGCTAPATPLPSLADIPGGTVRVTVCVDVEQLTPDLLTTFGFSIAGSTAKVSTLLPYENCP
jgi:Flp pilus assembly protein TadG